VLLHYIKWFNSRREEFSHEKDFVGKPLVNMALLKESQIPLVVVSFLTLMKDMP
jgi:hypothetical protein